MGEVQINWKRNEWKSDIFYKLLFIFMTVSKHVFHEEKTRVTTKGYQKQHDPYKTNNTGIKKFTM